MFAISAQLCHSRVSTVHRTFYIYLFCCLNQQLLSPLSDGLVHRAIAESGTAAMDVLLENEPLPVTQIVANMSGCSVESTKMIGDCMKNIGLDTIIGIVETQQLKISINVDGVFLTKRVDELFGAHELLTIPFMTGVNNDEGGWLLSEFFAPPNWTEGIDKEHITNMLNMFYPNPKDALFKELLTADYIGAGEDRVKNRDGFTEIIGDMMFTLPAIKAANIHRDAGAPTYLYEYQHTLKSMQTKRPSFVGSDHGDEIFAVLGLCFITTHIKLSEGCEEDEEQLSRTMMSYWGNFARTGSPNGDGLVHWPKYGAEEDYLSIDLKEQVTRQHLKKDKIFFLTRTVPEKIRQHKEKEERNEL